MTAYADSKRKLNEMGIEELCERIMAGESMTEICAGLEISRASLRAWVADDEVRKRQFDEARIAAAEAYEEQAEAGLKGAKTPFDLAQAKELAHHYRWKASKADPRRYGDKTEIVGAGGGPLQSKVSLDVAGLTTEQLRALASIPVLAG